MESQSIRLAPERLYLLRLAVISKGYKSLRKAGVLCRDISIDNLLINEDSNSYGCCFGYLCIHCEGPDETRVVARFDKWNHRQGRASHLQPDAELRSYIFPPLDPY